MSHITGEQVSKLDYLAEDISLARHTARLAANGQRLDVEQFQFQQRQLERALEALAAYRETLMVVAAERGHNVVISIAAKAAA